MVLVRKILGGNYSSYNSGGHKLPTISDNFYNAKSKNSLINKIKVLPINKEAKMPPDVSDTSKITVSLNSKNPTLSSIAPVSPKVLLTATLVQAATDDMKFHPSIRSKAYHEADATPKSLLATAR
ncbi:hypothetical protein ACTXT7_012335 [Hymenolepis weldensis]